MTPTARTIAVEELDPAALGACGAVLGPEPASGDDAPSYFGAVADFWHVRAFDVGVEGEPEVLWVRYRDASLVVARLEAHWCTEQAIVPLGTPIVQVVCPTRAGGSRLPDLERLRAFRVPVGRGICMARGCWHASFAPVGEATCLMLTRSSTTRELAAHLASGAPARETTIVDLAELGGPVVVSAAAGAPGHDSPFSSGAKAREVAITAIEGLPLAVAGTIRELAWGDEAVMVEVAVPAGYDAPPHAHDHESLVYVVAGRVLATVGTERRELGPGDAVLHRRGEQHAMRALTDARWVEVKAPPRATWPRP
jgi:ureidoglycolate lyase